MSQIFKYSLHSKFCLFIPISFNLILFPKPTLSYPVQIWKIPEDVIRLEDTPNPNSNRDVICAYKVFTEVDSRPCSSEIGTLHPQRYVALKVQKRYQHWQLGMSVVSVPKIIKSGYLYGYQKVRYGGLKYSNTTTFVDRNREVLASNKSPIIVVDILKTLFFILVWYTFNILLTLYNKKLLGDDQGKFPAPLLMNTIHFGMQAVFSKAIVYFWSERFQPIGTMSWKDYFMRGKNLAKSWLL
ncbi:hypothetical protein Hanom_Chr04g00339401 [Helianthus anomalus]